MAAVTVALPGAIALAADIDHGTLDCLLGQYVRDGRVDYVGIRDAERLRLDGYLERMAKIDLADHSREEKLAYYINVYNATVIQAVVDRYKPGYSVADDSFKLFDDKIVELHGGAVSLNHLENDLIRPLFKDPRIHAALVCAATSCPPLPSRAYHADDLDETLEANMRRFVNDPARNRIADGQASLSKIFEWYAEDFGGKDKLAAYLAKYTDVNVERATVDFLEYSWELNAAQRGS